MSESPDWQEVRDHYEALRHRWGRSPQGVGWGLKDRQLLRISACLSPWANRPLRVVDIGCGYGAALTICGRLGFSAYHGIDLLSAGPVKARPSWPGLEINWSEANFLDWTPDSQFDIGIASGTFNTKGNFNALDLLGKSLAWAKEFCREGFSFNVLRTPSSARDERLNYYGIGDLGITIEKFTSKFVIDNSILPFESTVHCFWPDDVDFENSKFA